MSEFNYKNVCENVNFYSHHIAPADAGASGVLSIANGRTTIPQVHDQTYTLTCVASTDSENNHLTLTSQPGGPSPALVAMDVAPNGVVTHSAGSRSNTFLELNCDNPSNPQAYTFQASNQTGGGLVENHLQLYSYNDAGIAQLLDIAPQDVSNNAGATVFMNLNVIGNLSTSKPFSALLKLSATQVVNAGSTSTATVNQSTQTFRVAGGTATVQPPASTSGYSVGQWVRIRNHPTSTNNLIIGNVFASSAPQVAPGASVIVFLMPGADGVTPMTQWDVDTF